MPYLFVALVLVDSQGHDGVDQLLSVRQPSSVDVVKDLGLLLLKGISSLDFNVKLALVRPLA